MSAPVTSVALVAAMLYAHGEVALARSYDVRPVDWATPCVALALDAAGNMLLPSRLDDESGCRPADSDACLRDRLCARVEAYEAGVSYDEVRFVSPTGVAFVTPTRVR